MQTPQRRAMLSGIALVLLACGLAGCKREAEPTPAPTAAPVVEQSSPAEVATATDASTGVVDSLSVYVRKYPLDKVGDHSFFQHPVVQEGVSRAVTDPKVLEAIAAMKGPVGPVMRKDNDIAASQCELHNCGAHNYAVHVDATSNSVSAVCYYDEKASPIATWYRSDGSKSSEGEGCSIG